MFDNSLTYVLMAATGPIATTVAQQPEVFFEGTAASVLGAVGLALWRCANLATKWLEGAAKHQELEVRQWDAAAEHRAAERAHWAAS